MGFTRSTTETDVHSTLGDYPAEDDHLTAEQLKERFDAPATGLKSDLNGLMDELEATDSAASVGATPIADGDTSGANVQAKLNKIYQDLQDAALGDIPDGSITEAKLNGTYAASLAKKDGNLQTGLNAEKLNGKTSDKYALKDGNLQTGLNAEKLGGSTKAQVIASITGRTSPTSTTYSDSSNTTHSVTATCRLYFVKFAKNGSAYHYNGAIYDCKTNKFLIVWTKKSNNEYFYLDQTELAMTESGGINAKLTTAYSSGVITLTVTASGGTAVTTFTPIDGLLP